MCSLAPFFILFSACVFSCQLVYSLVCLCMFCMFLSACVLSCLLMYSLFLEWRRDSPGGGFKYGDTSAGQICEKSPSNTTQQQTNTCLQSSSSTRSSRVEQQFHEDCILKRVATLSLSTSKYSSSLNRRQNEGAWIRCMCYAYTSLNADAIVHSARLQEYYI